jgi:hypothetical protein
VNTDYKMSRFSEKGKLKIQTAEEAIADLREFIQND